MTDELDPQTQQHIDDSADVAADTDAAACNDTDVDDATLDNGAATEIPTAEDAGEQNDDSAAQDDAPEKDAAPQAEGPIEVSSEEELDAVMDSMMDAVKAMKNAVADADIDAEEEEAAEAASTFVPGETPVADQGSTLPSFLQLEHPTIGADAVDPHAAGFSVVEGGTGSIATPQTPDAGTANAAHPTALHTPAASRDLGGAVSNTASAVGAFIAQGASAMREMNAAKKALADARAHLAELEQRIADQGEELKTRQDIAGRYDQIVAEQRQTIDTAQKAAAAAEIGRDTHAAKATELKAQLEQIKEEDDATERRLKAALDAVEAREASSRETGNRLVRRLEDSKRIRDKVQAERDAGVAAAQQTVDATRAQLETLRREYAELQRNPSANPANYTVRTSDVDERAIRAETPALLAQKLAAAKCRAVAESCPEDVVIGCDTVVDVDGVVFGKPADRDDARRMIRVLAGRGHLVHTGVCIAAQGRELCFAATTKVVFGALSDAEIEAYIATDDPYDKAGAYGVQNGAAKFVAGIEGCYFNVMGFPVSRVYNALKELDVL